MTLAPLREAARARPGTLLLATAAGLALLGAAAGGELAGGAVRVVSLLAFLALAAAVLGRQRAASPASRELEVDGRHLLGRDAGVALVSAGRRRFLVGFAPSGVTVLAELTAGEDP